MFRATDRRLAAAAALLAVAHVVRAWPKLDSVVDDAYISARYAEMLALGHGLTYNATEAPVEGYTNLLWVLQTALAWRIGGADPDRMLPYLVGPGLFYGAVGVACTVALTRALIGRPSWFAALPGLWIALDPSYAVVATNGIESSQWIAAVLLSVTAVVAGPSLPARARALPGVLAAVLVAIRPEGIAVAGALAAYEVLQAWRDGRVEIGPSAIGLVVGAVPVWLGRAAYFGALVPNTWAAKQHRSVTEQLSHNFDYLAVDAPYWVGVALIAALAWVPAWRAPRTLALGVAAGIAVVAFQVDFWMPGGRLLQPAVALATCAFASRLAEAHAGDSRVPLRARTGIVAVVVGLVVGGLVWGSIPRTVFRQDRNHTALPGNGAERAAQFLAAHLPHARIAVRDAGVFAYFAGPDATILETHERALTRRHPGGADTAPRAYVPDDVEVVVLTVQREDGADLRAENDFAMWQRIQHRYRFLGRVYQHHHRYYDVWVRPDLALPDLPDAIRVPFDPEAAPYQLTRDQPESDLTTSKPGQ